MNASELRSQYLEFFGQRQHRVLPSSPLVPKDPTLLFTSAGMVQFKDIFWGRTAPSFTRATTCQKCFRTTDIGNVGRTAFHNTFFEMLGNFSFGDYFKEGAIRLAWSFLTEELGVSADRLSVSVYHEDDEAYALWRDVIGLPGERITRLGKEHNWWGPVGDSGPCGPDSEIFYDTGSERGCGPDCRGVACDCNRYSEIWNLVFMEYEVHVDGRLAPLARKNIDTGMGLERTTAVLQGVESVFDTDLFLPVIEAVEAACPHALGETDGVHRNSIADHIRGVAFLLAEGVMPGNELQGYVLRRILRRAVRAGDKIDLPAGSLSSLVDPVVDVLGATYPEIVEARELAVRLIAREEETFRRTLRDGERRLVKLLEELGVAGQRVLPGALAFELTDTYGFPLELTEEIASEAGIEVDLEGFERALAAQRARSRIDVDASVEAEAEVTAAGDRPTRFLGYERCDAEAAVENVLRSGDGEIHRLVFPDSPFYAEAGGQVGDTGRIINLTRAGEARVVNVIKNAAGVYLHHGELVDGDFEIGDRCRLIVELERRRRIQRHHTATHLLHAALRQVLGSHVKQAGSEVNDRELRFDFSHFERPSLDQLARIEELATAAILADHPVTVRDVPLDEAQRLGAIGLFEDEYRGRERVRLVQVDDVSMELCGGTHVQRSGEIGLLKIVSEESVASGVRRIRAVAGDRALERMQQQEASMRRLREEIGDDPIEVVARLRDDLRAAQDRIETLASAEIRDVAGDLLERAVSIGDVRLIGGRADLPGDQLKQLADTLEEKARPAAIILVGESGGSGIAVCKRSTGVETLDAGRLIRNVAGMLGGGGGGGKPFAQGGGPNVDRLDEALRAGLDAAREALA